MAVQILDSFKDYFLYHYELVITFVSIVSAIYRLKNSRGIKKGDGTTL